MGWPLECWDVSTAFLCARLFGDRDTDLGGDEIFMRPSKILVDVGVVQPRIVWKIKRDCVAAEHHPLLGKLSKTTLSSPGHGP